MTGFRQVCELLLLLLLWYTTVVYYCIESHLSLLSHEPGQLRGHGIYTRVTVSIISVLAASYLPPAFCHWPLGNFSALLATCFGCMLLAASSLVCALCFLLLTTSYALHPTSYILLTTHHSLLAAPQIGEAIHCCKDTAPPGSHTLRTRRCDVAAAARWVRPSSSRVTR